MIHQISKTIMLAERMHYDVTFDAVAVTLAVPEPIGLFFFGCVARPFFSKRGIMSVALDRLMFFRQTGHWERRGPSWLRFSPAIRASMRQVWQKRWPAS